MKKLTKLLLLLGCIICIQSCNDDDLNRTGGPLTDPGSEAEAEALRDQQFQNENFGNTTTGKFIGTVTDTSGNRLENVQITIGNAVTVTNTNGIFILNDVDVFENFAYIKAEKEGYIKGSRVVIPKTQGTNSIHIVLLEKEVTATVNSGEVSQVALPTGAEVNFTGDFITADGSEYNGPVEVVLHYIHPNSEETFTQMPGSLFAQTETNEASVLETYGMLSVNLFSASGEALNIDSNHPATIEFPVDATQTSIAPETIPLWYFDEENGYWKEEGQATKEGSKYVAEVSHFTWWNCDIPSRLVNFCFSIEPLNMNTTAPYFVLITRVSNGQFIYGGPLFANEVECGVIPRDEEILVSIYNVTSNCNNYLVHSETFGGYSVDATETIAFMENAITTPITGIAQSCDGAPITNGYLLIDDAHIFSITNGTIDVTYTSCVVNTVSIQVVDLDTSLRTVIQNVVVDGTPIDLGTVNACDSDGGIYYGDLTLETQQEVDDFGLFGYVEIEGDVFIGSGSQPNSIVDLSALASLERIVGGLNILNNAQLTSLTGLDNLTYTKGLVIANNDQLVSLTGLQSLTTIIVSLIIENNNSLPSLAGLDNVTFADFIRVRGNNALNSLSGISGITELIILEISENPMLVDLTGLEQITTLTNIWILNNNSLQSLNGLQNVTTITESAFEPEVAIGVSYSQNALPAAPNPNLTNLCALQTLFGNITDPDINIVIANNAYNPSTLDIINGNCSQ